MSLAPLFAPQTSPLVTWDALQTDSIVFQRASRHGQISAFLRVDAGRVLLEMRSFHVPSVAPLPSTSIDRPVTVLISVILKRATIDFDRRLILSLKTNLIADDVAPGHGAVGSPQKEHSTTDFR